MGGTRLRGYSCEVTGEAANCINGSSRPGGGLPGSGERRRAWTRRWLPPRVRAPINSSRSSPDRWRLRRDVPWTGASVGAAPSRAASGDDAKRCSTLSFPLAQAFGVLPVVGATGQFRTCPGQSTHVKDLTMGTSAGHQRILSDGGAHEPRGPARRELRLRAKGPSENDRVLTASRPTEAQCGHRPAGTSALARGLAGVRRARAEVTSTVGVIRRLASEERPQSAWPVSGCRSRGIRPVARCRGDAGPKEEAPGRRGR